MRHEEMAEIMLRGQPDVELNLNKVRLNVDKPPQWRNRRGEKAWMYVEDD